MLRCEAAYVFRSRICSIIYFNSLHVGVTNTKRAEHLLGLKEAQMTACREVPYTSSAHVLRFLTAALPQSGYLLKQRWCIADSTQLTGCCINISSDFFRLDLVVYGTLHQDSHVLVCEQA